MTEQRIDKFEEWQKRLIPISYHAKGQSGLALGKSNLDMLNDWAEEREQLLEALRTIRKRWHCEYGMATNEPCELLIGDDPREWCGWCYVNRILNRYDPVEADR